MNNLNIEIYSSFDQATPYLIAWITLFYFETLYKIFSMIFFKKSYRHFGIKSELPGIPLTLMHTYVWVLSIINFDLITCLLFTWWGPGFLICAYIFLFIKDFNWPKYGKITSFLCKAHYLIYICLFFYFKTYGLVFVFSVWIIQDQICLIWFEKNADRARRLTEDKWFIRFLYPLCLFTPFVFTMRYQLAYQILGTALFLTWALSIAKILKDKNFYDRPKSYKEFLRNIVYAKKT
jgi:hypothetical protein